MNARAFLQSGFLGVAVLAGLSSSAHASGWLRRGHSGDCQQEVIRLPSQEVVVETTRPRVIVNETRFSERAVRGGRVALMPQPMVATFYTPLALPGFESQLLTVPPTELRMLGTSEYRDSRSSNFLRALHDFESQHLEVRRQLALQEADRKATEEVFGRLANSFRAPPATTPRSEEPNVKAEIMKELDKLRGRVEKLETLIKVHDELLDKKVQYKTP